MSTTPAEVSDFTHRTVTREDWIPLSDGCRLYSRTVLPEDARRTPVPAVLEYLPYRLTDGTAHRDATQHPYFAGHGYASVRVDIRGTGNSDGILMDEYLPSEQEDGCEVIAWLARQPWCSGAVGIYGKSWGGFNGLQIAARRPPELKAVIAANFTDDRYADDVHYLGGCVLAQEALPWASFMLGINALPPDPRIVGDRWREMWHERLERTPFFMEEWMRHQRRDAFWRQGSVCEDFGAIQAPTLLVGGYNDGYTNAVPRTLAGLTEAGVPCRALVGPWSHGWPHVSEPGPRIGFLQECVRWWDRWLRGVDNDAMDAPLLRAYVMEYDPPGSRQRMRKGRWVREDAWPPAGATPVSLYPGAGGTLEAEPGREASERILGSERSGSDAGAWCPYGEPTDFPDDQRAEDGLALSYTSQPLHERLELLGFPEVTLELSVDRPMALVAVRLCDVAPDGRSLLLARGLLNLTHRDSHAEPVVMPVGERVTVAVRLDLVGYAFGPGHRIRLAVSPCYWPYAWPSPEPVTLELALGGASRLELPLQPAPAHEPGEGGPAAADTGGFGPPEQAPAAAGSVEHDVWRSGRYELPESRTILELGSDTRSRLAEPGPEPGAELGPEPRAELEFGERMVQQFSLRAGAPLSARVECTGAYYLRRAGWDVSVRLSTSMSADAERFTVTRDLDAYEGDVRVHSTRSTVQIPRDGA